MKKSEQYLKRLLRKSINETLDEKADKLMDKIKKSEMEEGRDDHSIKIDYNPRDFKNANIKDLLKNINRDSLTPEEDFIRNIDLEDELFGDDEDLDPYIEGDEEPLMEGEMCEQCGGGLSEGECTECGYNRMNEGIYDESEEFDDDAQDFDYIQGEEYEDETLKNYCSKGSHKYNFDRCKYHTEIMKDQGKIPMEERNKFTGMLAKSRKGDKFTLNGKQYTDTSNYDVNEGVEYHIKDNVNDIIKLTENELINLIENIFNEQKNKLKTIGKPNGLATYEKVHKESGKENKEYMKSLGSKMKDYLKDGSKGKFDMNPKQFPKGNGELGKMDKKAFQMTDDLEDLNYEIAGQQFPTTDGVGYDEKRMEKYFKGDSTTGNAPGGNALDSKANERFDKMRKKNTLKKIKDQSYKRVPQPVFNETSTDEDGKLNLKLETINERKVNMLNEEFNRIKELLRYNRKTQ